MSENRFLAAILALFTLLSITYAVVTPVFEASDELWHYPMVRHLADGNPLPVQVFDPALAGPWNQEASQPPLYYYLGAALTFWIDTADMEQVRWLNPHVDNGVITQDGNINLVVHDPAFSPWQGTLLAVRIVRLFSVFLGAVTVYLTYRIGKEITPERPEIGLGAAAVNAFMPMFLFISGAVNNDNLAIPLASLALLLMIRQVKCAQFPIPHSPFTIHNLSLGVVIGLALLTKEGTLGLLPLAWGTAFVAAYGKQSTINSQQSTDNRRLLLKAFGRSWLEFGVVLVPAVLIAGWWYYRNVMLYGDWLGWNAFIAVLGQRPQPATLAQLWGERWGFMLSYWGLFGGVNVPMWLWIYRLLNGILIAGVVGFGVYLVQEIRDWSVGFHLRSLLSDFLQFIASRFALVVCLLFATAVVLGLVRWATTTWSSQGRLVFTAISALNVLFLLGLAGWLPLRAARGVIAVVAAFMFLIAAAAPFLWIRPAYQPGSYHPPAAFELISEPSDFGGRIRLVGYAVEPAAADTSLIRPGESVDIVLEWEVLRPMARDWSVFVHLVDPVLESPIAQRDMYHGQGLRPTSLLAPGEKVTNFYHLTVPETAVAPAQLELMVGLYEFHSGERLKLENGLDAEKLTSLQLTAVPGQQPNPTAINFGDELQLAGFEVKPRRALAGQTIDLVLYWRPERPLATNYTFFAQVVDEDTTRWAAHDFAPLEGTASWRAGEVYSLTMPLALAAETPARVYPLIIGVYTRTADGGFQRLQLVAEDGRITQEDFLTLTKIRVD